MIVGIVTPDEAAKILTIGDIYDAVVNCGDIEEWVPPRERTLYLGVFEFGCIVGICVVDFTSFHHANVHFGMTEGYRGAYATMAGRECIRWLKNNTKLVKITAPILTHNKKTKLYARNLGFDPYGVNTGAALHNGVLCDVALYGLSLLG